MGGPSAVWRRFLCCVALGYTYCLFLLEEHHGCDRRVLQYDHVVRAHTLRFLGEQERVFTLVLSRGFLCGSDCRGCHENQKSVPARAARE